MTFLSQFSSFFRDGGPFMFVILGVAVLMAGGALERFWVVARASSWNGRKLVRDLSERVLKGDVRGATELAKRVSSPIGQVAHAILSSGSRSEEALYSAGDGEASIALAPLSRRLAFLSLLSNTAMLLGLLGTIFGLTTAFSAVGAADPAQKSAFLALGISQALNTTAFGLIVAVPGLLIQGFLASRVERIGEQVDEAVVRLARTMASRPSASAATLADEAAAMMPARPSAMPAPGYAPTLGPSPAAPGMRPDPRAQPRVHR